jgi:hypothetical protein
MKRFLIALILVFIGIRLLPLFPELEPLRAPSIEPEQLLPPFLAPRKFSDIEQGIKDSHHDPCIASAYHLAWADNPVPRHGSTGRRADVTAYLVCYIERAREFPKQLCVGDGKDQLARYTRGYFALLAAQRDAPAAPQAFVEMQRQLDTGSDIQSGLEDFSPDPRIIDGLKSLISDGVFIRSDDLAAKLSPEVPSSVIAELTATEPGRPVCP